MKLDETHLMSAAVRFLLNGTRMTLSRVLSRLRGVGRVRVGPFLFLISLAGPVLGVAVFLGAVTLNKRMVTGQCPMRVVSNQPHALGIACFLGWEVLFGVGVLVSRNVTRRKRAEEMSGHLSNAVEQTADAVFITDRSGVIEYVNPAFETITGFPTHEALGSNPRILKSGVQDHRYYHGLWSAITNGQTFRATTINRRKCGRIFHAEQTITPMRVEGGNITHFVSVLKDMTERRKIQEQETEMKIAAAVQRRLYPRSSPCIPGYDLSGAAFSADATCGDYFDFLNISDDKLGIVVADVCGHGIGPAMVMAETRAYLRAYIRSNLDPSEIFRRINNVLNADLEDRFFVTMVLVILDLSTGQLVYANAGHPSGYILAEAGGIRDVLESTGLPLGLFPDGEFTSRRDLQLGSGDLLVLLTDGIIESEGPDETEFGVERILDIVKSNRGESAEDIVNTLFNAAREFEDGQPQADDITLVACKRGNSWPASTGS